MIAVHSCVAETAGEIAGRIANRRSDTSSSERSKRYIVALAGPPATGKSTVAELLSEALSKLEGVSSVVVPMDGFHLDNGQLDDLGLRQRKGAPETIDFAGLAVLLGRLSDDDGPIYFPLFDRTKDLAIAGAGRVEPSDNVILVEGNYLLLNEDPWSILEPCFDLAVFLETPLPVLQERLTQRWLQYGHDPAGAYERAMLNDVPNAELVLNSKRSPDIVLKVAPHE